MRVGSMNIDVASGGPTTSGEVVLGSAVGVAFKTKPLGISQQVVGVATVGEVAGETSIASGRLRDIVAVRKRPLLVGMAGKAQLVPVGDKLRIVHARVRIVARVAAQLPFLDRMMRPHVKLGPLLGVARTAKLELIFFDQETGIG